MVRSISNVVQRLALDHLPVPMLRRSLASGRAPAAVAGKAAAQLLVDVSVIVRGDSRTGIQRVVRNLYVRLRQSLPPGWRVRPVAASRTEGYCYVPETFLDMPLPAPMQAPAEAAPGDTFLGLDLATATVPRRLAQLGRWKGAGVRQCFFVYDLLPVLAPAWFSRRTVRDFRRWLRAVAVLADEVYCISREVKADFDDWVRERHGLDARAVLSSVVSLGADLDVASLPQHADPSPEGSFVLMVGTIEPRKGHGEALDAFEALWAAGDETRLVMAGRQGWMVEPLVARLRGHPEFGRRLHWIESPSDEALAALYRRAVGVLIASRGEGLGLPLLEAAYFGKPVLARGLPVFLEVAGGSVRFFDDEPGRPSALDVRRWLDAIDASPPAGTAAPECVTWDQSAAHLGRLLVASPERERQ